MSDQNGNEKPHRERATAAETLGSVSSWWRRRRWWWRRRGGGEGAVLFLFFSSRTPKTKKQPNNTPFSFPSRDVNTNLCIPLSLSLSLSLSVCVCVCVSVVFFWSPLVVLSFTLANAHLSMSVFVSERRWAEPTALFSFRR